MSDQGPGLPVGASQDSLGAELEQRVERDQFKRSWGRLAAAGVSGCATLGFSLVGAVMVVLGVVQGSILGTLVVVAMFGIPAVLFGWLTWRWGRGLPPIRVVATKRELEELDA